MPTIVSLTLIRTVFLLKEIESMENILKQISSINSEKSYNLIIKLSLFIW